MRAAAVALGRSVGLLAAGLLAVGLLAVGLARPAMAETRVAVPDFRFTDGSGEARDQSAVHHAQLALFNESLRAGLETGGLEVVVPTCDGGACSPDRTGFEAMAEATRGLDAKLLLVGGLHKVSTLIGTIRVSLIDLDADKVICARSLSYRGDDSQAWSRAAEFTATDLLRGCFQAPAS